MDPTYVQSCEQHRQWLRSAGRWPICIYIHTHNVHIFDLSMYVSVACICTRVYNVCTWMCICKGSDTTAPGGFSRLIAFSKAMRSASTHLSCRRTGYIFGFPKFCCRWFSGLRLWIECFLSVNLLDALLFEEWNRLLLQAPVKDVKTCLDFKERF